VCDVAMPPTIVAMMRVFPLGRAHRARQRPSAVHLATAQRLATSQFPDS